jgi:NAD-dependent SIR2 family protein deacetylase
MTLPEHTRHCAKCGNTLEPGEVNADDLCSVCEALASLRHTLEMLGRVHPDLFDDHGHARSQLPPGDRE